MTTLDRMFLLTYARSYVIVLTSLLSLYVVIDLFTNIDAFTRADATAGKAAATGLSVVGERILQYYSAQIALIFDRMAEAISLIAAMFAVSWMQRNNELLPQLSAGIPTRRVLRPVMLGSAITLSFGPLNQEFVIPQIANRLMVPKDDLEGAKAQVVNGAYDPAGVHIEGMAGLPKEQLVLKFYATFPEYLPNGEPSPIGMVHLSAEKAYYVPPDGTENSGGWLMTGTTPVSFDRELPKNLKAINPGQFFLYTKDVTFSTVTRGATWVQYAKAGQLRELLARPEARRQSKVAVLFHMRFTRPIVGALLVLLGLSVILRNPNRHVFISSGLCLVFSASFHMCVLGCKFLGEQAYVSPPFAAWLPVLLFGPITLVSFDSIHT